MNTPLLSHLAWLYLAILVPFVYGKQQDVSMINPNFSEMASTAEVDNSPCDIIFLPDDEGNQKAHEVWAASTSAKQVLREIYC